MRAFLKLYLKDLKSVYKMGLILFLIELGFRVLNILPQFFFNPVDRLGNNHVIHLGRQFSYALPYIFPVILIYIMLTENRTKTIYQLSSLPIKKFELLTSKFLAVFSISFLVIILWAIIDTHFWQPFTIDKYKLQYMNKLAEIHGKEYPSPFALSARELFSAELIRSIVIISFIQITSLFFVILPQVISEIVRKYRIITWIMVFMITIWMFTLWIRINGNGSEFVTLIGILVFGLILFLSSLILYEKFKEI